MDSIRIPSSERSPEVCMDFAQGQMSLKGESYPEDVASFYGPLLSSLDSWLATKPDVALTVDIELVYFNSSSAKALMNLFMLLEKAAAAGAAISVNWHFSSDDDTMQEFGEDFAEDLEHVRFTLCPTDAD